MMRRRDDGDEELMGTRVDVKGMMETKGDEDEGDGDE